VAPLGVLDVFLSVLVDTYNHERLIEKALRSVLDQNCPPGDFEILVVDDGSTDKTPEIVRQFAPRVRLIRKKNGGQASAFNAGIPECRGDVIVFLDGDDWWAQGKLRKIAAVFSADAALGMVGHAFIESSDDGSERTITSHIPSSLRLDSEDGASFFRLSRCYFGTSRLALRADVARKILPIPEALVFEADEYLFTMAAGLENALVLPDALTHYRVHAGNLFLGAGGSSAGERRKAAVLAALAGALQQSLPSTGAAPQAVALAIEMVQAEADQLRLKLDGGWPWETFSTERTIYRIQHGDAHWKSRSFRTLSTKMDAPAVIGAATAGNGATNGEAASGPLPGSAARPRAGAPP